MLAGDERKLGWIGELHPLVARAWDLDGRWPRSSSTSTRSPSWRRARTPYRDVTSFPAVLQDIAVVVPEDVPGGRGGGGGPRGRRRPARRASSVFDLYRGEQVGEGSKSLALRLEFRAPDRTLTDEEVAERRARDRGASSSEIGGRLRA